MPWKRKRNSEVGGKKKVASEVKDFPVKGWNLSHRNNYFKKKAGHVWPCSKSTTVGIPFDPVAVLQKFCLTLGNTRFLSTQSRFLAFLPLYRHPQIIRLGFFSSFLLPYSKDHRVIDIQFWGIHPGQADHSANVSLFWQVNWAEREQKLRWRPALLLTPHPAMFAQPLQRSSEGDGAVSIAEMRKPQLREVE